MKICTGRNQNRNSRAFKFKLSSLSVACFLVISCATTPEPSPPQFLSAVIPTMYERVVGGGTTNVTISSEPSGAKVYVDNTFIGETPITIPLQYQIAEAGVSIEGQVRDVQKFPYINSYSFSIYKEGYEAQTGDLTVPTEGCAYGVYGHELTTVEHCPLGWYKVDHNSNLIEICVPIDPNPPWPPTGKAVYRRACWPHGKSNLLVFLKPIPGRQPIIQQQQQQQQQIIIEKSKAQSYLSVTSDPPEAEVYLDDSLIGTTPITSVKLKPGNYRLKVVKGNKTWERNILLPEEGSLQIKADFK
jgi:hypothetical protein